MFDIGTYLFSKIYGEKIGEDEFGNKYYRSNLKHGRNVGRYNKERRWVIYRGKKEPSKIPAIWHCWMHYATDEIPSKVEEIAENDWQKVHLPNLTGTKFRHIPAGHDEAKGQRNAAIGDYQAWQPK